MCIKMILKKTVYVGSGTNSHRLPKNWTRFKAFNAVIVVCWFYFYLEFTRINAAKTMFIMIEEKERETKAD